ncbi:MAG: adenylate/guanylate cyclase domain-containing protein [Ignavibacteriales bacterium]|nr:adenylate/guanylate cyclase domain-containing protein [Ignavibacteriales bacterium]
MSEAHKKFFFTKQIRIVFSAIAGLMTAWLISLSPVGNRVEMNALDIQFRFGQGSHKPDSSVVILTIDQNSLQYFKHNSKTSWPWPRDFYAVTTDYLAKGGAKAIVYDFHFNEPDEDRVISSGADNDSLFAQSIRNAGNVFLSTQLTHQYEEDQPGDTLIKFPDHTTDLPVTQQYHFDKTFAPLIPFQEGAKGIGVVNFIPDEDGVCRRVPLVYELHGKQLHALSFSIYHDLFRQESSIDRTVSSPYLIYWYGRGGPDGVFKYYSIHSVVVSAMKELQGMTPDVPAGIFKDKIVFIGSNAPGLLDLRPTPFTYLEPYPGVEIHATALSNFLQNHFIQEVPFFLLLLICIFIAIAVSLLSNYNENIVTSTVGVLVVIALFLLVSNQLFTHQLIWLKAVFPVTSAMLTYIVSVAWNFATEGRSKRQIQKIFGQFVNPHIVKQLSANPEGVELGGEEVDASIMFSDIEGFTSISETKKPKELVEFLNNYFSTASDIFFKHEGTIDKFIGDAVMVQFGIPLKNPNHRIHAVRAAFEFSQTVYNMTKAARERGEPVFSTRIGINSGNMVVGYIGGRTKKEYTVIGDTVNLASRLEGVNKYYGTSVMISESTVNEQVLDEFLLREMDLIRVKGKKLPIKIYEVFCRKSEISEERLTIVQTFESGLKLYREQHWNDAIAMFRTVLKLNEKDYASAMYIERCEECKKNPPGKEWDGVYVMTSK